MSDKPQAIQELEQELGITLAELRLETRDSEQYFNIVRHRHRDKYLLDGEGNIVGLNISHHEEGVERIDLQPYSEALIHLRYLAIVNNNLKALKLPEELPELKWLNTSRNQLERLDLRSEMDALEKLEVQNNKLNRLYFPTAMPNLFYLEMSYNKGEIKALNLPRGFDKLNFFYAYQSGVQKLNIKGDMPVLKELDLRGSGLKELKMPGEFPMLEVLDLQDNALERIEWHFLELKALKHLTLAGNPNLQTIDPDLVATEGNVLEAVTSHYQAIKTSGKVRVYEVKLIIVGNGRVGKTCVVKQMLDGKYDPDEPSTHAIQFRKMPLPTLADEKGFERVQVNIWDFGGQDIYHATHRLFMKNKAVFLLVWDWETEMKDPPIHIEKVGKNKDREIQYKLHQLPYWLNYADVLGRDKNGRKSLVIIAQNKIDNEHGKKPFPYQPLLEQRGYSQVKDILRVSALQNRGFKALEESIEQTVSDLLEQQQVEIARSWENVRQAISNLQEVIQEDPLDNDEKQMTVSSFEALCEAQGVPKSAVPTLLNYFHQTGLFFYQKNLFGGKIILDQTWAIKAVYALFDRSGEYFEELVAKGGRFDATYLAKIWSEYNEEERALFVSFMEACEICVELPSAHQGESYLRSFSEKQFLAPQLLPEEAPASIQYAFDGDEGLYLAYQHEYLHDGIIQQLIVRTLPVAENPDLWKYGILLMIKGRKALVQAFPKEQRVVVRIKGEKDLDLLWELKELLDEIQKDEQGIITAVSTDGQCFIEWNKLQNHNADELTHIVDIKGNQTPVEPLLVFMPEKKESMRHKKLARDAKEAEKLIPEKDSDQDRSYLHKDYIDWLLLENRIREAIDELQEGLKASRQQELASDTLIQGTKYVRCYKEYRKQLISYQEYDRHCNNVVAGLKETLQDYKPSLPYDPKWVLRSTINKEPEDIQQVTAENPDNGRLAEAYYHKAVFLAANPKGSFTLRLDEEFRRIHKAVQKQAKNTRIELVTFWEVTPNELIDTVEDEEPDILHFSGHGQKISGFQATVEELYDGYASTGAGLMFEVRGESHLMTTDSIEESFSYFKDEDCAPRLVILNACHSLDQAKAISKYVNFVIGTTNEVNDDAALYFAEGFYKGLAKGKDERSAFKRAKASARNWVGRDKTEVFRLYIDGEEVTDI